MQYIVFVIERADEQEEGRRERKCIYVMCKLWALQLTFPESLNVIY